ncbi:hypothetical protein PSA7680_02660 [Pseudoruegeria aquimaris]|uniref:Uncharacterized protein n=1 Tax=Pseudoruegeria aquimaris TaxID=393663 RepID=A0A1Y5SYT8_9RHOB|nr:hypothetical protein PSA7680_02660 [Pseudoruegeria aquimaris]
MVDGGATGGLVAPVADHLVGDGRAVHDAGNLGHVEVESRLAHLLQLLAHAHVDHEGARRHQVARGDQLTEPDLVGHIVEDLAQPLPVAPVGRGGDAEDARLGIGVPHPVDDPPVTVGNGVMRLVDHQQVELRHGAEIAVAAQGRRHGEGDLAIPGLGGGIDHRGGHVRVDPAELLPVLGRQFIAMGQHAGLGAVAGHLARDGGQHDGLARSGRSNPERIAVGRERSEAALHEEFLAGTKAHGRALTRPRTGGPAWTARWGSGRRQSAWR